MAKAEFTIKQHTWVGLAIGAFLAWAAIITLVVVFAAYSSSIEPPEKPKVCRGEFGTKRPCPE